ncbi:uncharacterized protein LOC142768646 isoform X5 [Rhipicephalus microplus]|uniref:uncharacterized protein LOC142768646 isoform X5 n=1 Tax=Rhipicephalus microplus TaxID=6941 RepID=UPI003F6CE6C5
MKYSFAAILFFGILIVVVAEDSGRSVTCDGTERDENYIDGYKFLADNTRLYLVMTTLTSMFEMPDDTRIQCISSVTTAKNDDEHELLETVDYKNGTSEDWGKFSQAFEFLGESGEYNKMKLKEKNELVVMESTSKFSTNTTLPTHMVMVPLVHRKT